jgi:phosphonoacetaldehyde hydrolase
MRDRIRLVIFDWAGTTVDHGCFAPVAPFVEVLRQNGVAISMADARGPMGLDKKDHLRALLELPAARGQWREAHGSDPSERDVVRLFDEMVPLAVESVRMHSHVIAGVPEVVDGLRRRGIAVGSTTGYFREAADACFALAASEGYAPDASACASDVPRARPAPWMIYRNMEALGVYPAACVLKVGDTVPDVQEALAAGCWSAGVVASSNDVGLTEADLAALAPDERAGRFAAVATKLTGAGAHATMETLAELPDLIDDIDERLARGESPGASRPSPILSA